MLEIGGAGTLEQSLNAIRHGGHINIIGYMTGIEMGITVFPLIIKNANFTASEPVTERALKRSWPLWVNTGYSR